MTSGIETVRGLFICTDLMKSCILGDSNTARGRQWRPNMALTAEMWFTTEE